MNHSPLAHLLARDAASCELDRGWGGVKAHSKCQLTRFADRITNVNTQVIGLQPLEKKKKKNREDIVWVRMPSKKKKKSDEDTEWFA